MYGSALGMLDLWEEAKQDNDVPFLSKKSCCSQKWLQSEVVHVGDMRTQWVRVFPLIEELKGTLVHISLFM